MYHRARPTDKPRRRPANGTFKELKAEGDVRPRPIPKVRIIFHQQDWA